MNSYEMKSNGSVKKKNEFKCDQSDHVNTRIGMKDKCTQVDSDIPKEYVYVAFLDKVVSYQTILGNILASDQSIEIKHFKNIKNFQKIPKLRKLQFIKKYLNIKFEKQETKS